MATALYMACAVVSVGVIFSDYWNADVVFSPKIANDEDFLYLLSVRNYGFALDGGSFVWHSEISCAPNTTVYEKWGKPSGYCDKEMPEFKQLYSAVLTWQAIGSYMYVEAFGVIQKRAMPLVAAACYVVSAVGLYLFYRIRLRWIGVLQRNVNHLPYRTTNGEVSVLPVDELFYSNDFFVMETILILLAIGSLLVGRRDEEDMTLLVGMHLAAAGLFVVLTL